ncbi:VOC family protein [Portibacter lacus]|uniref:Ring-cleaving dioxygenase n=1 Tax=Portibacter lacus TaxID=1099794 RepID=A0AA37WEK9_9BACT|nr:VOC family protein [Portibacter lacus]GLR16200.1 ring-cleaving dioxygenase [Portibacter lacus]
MENIQPFHLAIPVQNLERARAFYRDILGCPEGRSASHWVDFNFFGHQLVIHVKEDMQRASTSNPVDGHDVPIPHFGVVLKWEDWENLSAQLKASDIPFVIEPYIRFTGLPGEQATMFFMDTEGNSLEFKAFKDIGQLFAK